MKKLTSLLLLLALLPSCRKPLFDHPPRDSFRGGDSVSRSQEQGDSPGPPAPEPPAVLQTALCYADTAAWRAGGSTPERILLFKNGALAAEYPACGKTSDPERHRLHAGHLWEDVTNGFETVIYRDGEEFLRFPGEERMQGFLCLDGTVHSLGQRPGRGICYRIDGKEVFSDEGGVALGWASDPEWPGGALMEDGGKVYFTYSIGEEYRVMCGDKLLKTIPPSSGVHDVRVLDSVIYSLEKRKDGMYLVRDGKAFLLGTVVAAKQHLVAIDGKMMMKSLFSSDRWGRCWMRDEKTTYYDQQFKRGVAIFQAGGGEKAWALLDGENCILEVWKNDSLVEVPPETYRLSLDRCALFREGIFALALTADSGDGHCLLIDGKQIPVRFNGFFTGTYIE